jgi:hypothetical protein
MLSHWMIKLLNLVFVSSLGIVALWLFSSSLASGWVRRVSPSKRAELFLRVSRNGSPYMKLPLEKSHYLIGRGPECDILLKGQGIPLGAGEIYLEDGEYVFKNRETGEIAKKKILPGDELILYNYVIQIEGKRQDESIWTNRHRQKA